jgi:shikimate kinase
MPEDGRVAGDPGRIVLVGFMGSGKTTVGAHLARHLGWRFLDLDRLIEARQALTVAEIFATRGEAFFRDEEQRAAEEAAGLTSHVVATGGGAFSLPATRAALQRGATVVWLRCDLETLLSRIPPDRSRPLAGSRERMAALLVEREPSYRLADLSVDSSPEGADGVARRILETIRQRGSRDAER